MPHFLRPPTGKRMTLRLTAAEFSQIEEARDKLFHAMTIEEKFVMLLENFVEFENELLAITQRRAVLRWRDWDDFQDDIYTVNRRLSNLLSSCRLYVDQLHTDLALTYGRGSAAAGLVDDALAKERTNRLGFAVMEAVRNQLQHRTLAIEEMSFPGDRHEEDGVVSLRHRIEPRMRLVHLKSDTRVDRSLLKRLEGLGDSVTVTRWVREYVEGLARVHSAFQDATKEDVESWEQVLKGVLERATKRFGELRFGVVAEQTGTASRRVHIIREIVDRRRSQSRRTALASHISKQVISSAASPK